MPSSEFPENQDIKVTKNTKFLISAPDKQGEMHVVAWDTHPDALDMAIATVRRHEKSGNFSEEAIAKFREGIAGIVAIQNKAGTSMAPKTFTPDESSE